MLFAERSLDRSEIEAYPDGRLDSGGSTIRRELDAMMLNAAIVASKTDDIKLEFSEESDEWQRPEIIEEAAQRRINVNQMADY